MNKVTTNGLTAWSDSMLHAWDQASFSDSENEEEEEELPHEISQQPFHEYDLNRRLDYDALNRVNLYFERFFDLAGQSLSYRRVEEIAVNAQADVIAILRNIIACQQQHTEALRHAADFWRNCHDGLFNEFVQFRERMDGVPGDMRLLITEQNLTVNALSLISERLNLLQRMMSKLYEHIFRR